MAWLPWSDFRGFLYRLTFCPMYSWVVRLGTRSAVSRCSSNSRNLPEVRVGLLLVTVVFVPVALLAQLTTGAIEGTLRDSDGHPVAGTAILITGGVGFRTVVHSSSKGGFAITLPYGRYRHLKDGPRGEESSGTTVFVAPLRDHFFAPQPTATAAAAEDQRRQAGITSSRDFPPREYTAGRSSVSVSLAAHG